MCDTRSSSSTRTAAKRSQPVADNYALVTDKRATYFA